MKVINLKDRIKKKKFDNIVKILSEIDFMHMYKMKGIEHIKQTLRCVIRILEKED